MARAQTQAGGLVFALLAGMTAIAFISDIFFIFLVAPTEARMGIVQKIFYFHVPSAYAMYLGALACLSLLWRSWRGRAKSPMRSPERAPKPPAYSVASS